MGVRHSTSTELYGEYSVAHQNSLYTSAASYTRTVTSCVRHRTRKYLLRMCDGDLNGLTNASLRIQVEANTSSKPINRSVDSVARVGIFTIDFIANLLSLFSF